MRLFWFPTVCCISFVCYTFSLLWAWTDCDTAKQLALTEWTTERRGSKRLWTHHQPEMSRTVFLSGRNLTHRKKKKAKLLHIVDCMDTHASILSHYTSCCKVQCSYWWRIKVSFSFSTQAASFFGHFLLASTVDKASRSTLPHFSKGKVSKRLAFQRGCT